MSIEYYWIDKDIILITYKPYESPYKTLSDLLGAKKIQMPTHCTFVCSNILSYKDGKILFWKDDNDIPYPEEYNSLTLTLDLFVHALSFIYYNHKIYEDIYKKTIYRDIR